MYTQIGEHFTCSVHKGNTIRVTWSIQDSLVNDLIIIGRIEYFLVTLWDAQNNQAVYREEIKSHTDNSKLVTPFLYNNYKCSVTAYGQYNMGLSLLGTQTIWIPDTGRSTRLSQPIHTVAYQNKLGQLI